MDTQIAICVEAREKMQLAPFEEIVDPKSALLRCL